nr:Metal-nicotianamine transporter YSL1 [Ipomoea batatas]
MEMNLVLNDFNIKTKHCQFQETSSWVHEILLDQFPVEFLSVVLLWGRPVRICKLPTVRVESLEAIILLRFQHDLHRCRNDLFPPRKFVSASWSCSVLGDYVALDSRTQRILVPCNFIRKQHEESDWLQGFCFDCSDPGGWSLQFSQDTRFHW